MLLLIPALLMVSLPQVDTHELRTHKWFCSASGETFEHRNQSVSGPFRPTQPAAEQAAIQQCLSSGLMACRVGTCIDESMPAPLSH